MPACFEILKVDALESRIVWFQDPNAAPILCLNLFKVAVPLEQGHRGVKPVIFRVGELPPGIAQDRGFTGAAQFSEDIFQNVCRRVTGVDEELGNPFIGIAEEQQTSCRFAVTAGTADFLVIGLHRIRNICVHH